MVSWNDLEDYKRVSSVLEKRVNHDLAVLLNKVKHRSRDDIRDVFVEYVPAIIDKYGSASAGYAARWFEKLTDKTAFVPELYKPEAWESSTRWALSPLYDDRHDLREAFTHIVQVAHREVKNHGRHTVAESVKAYDDVKYARVLTGLTSCSFCVMLSSRGPVYGSKEVAELGYSGETYHTNCDCIAVPMRGEWEANPKLSRGVIWRGDKIAGYDFDDLYEREYKPFHRKNDSIKQVIARRDAHYAEWQKREAARAAEYARRGGSLDQPTLQKESWRAFRDNKDLKYDGLPPDEWATAKPIPRRFTQLPIAWPETLPSLSTKQWNHILYGFGRGGGHLHGYGWVSGGSEFPRSMTPRDIAALLKEFLTSAGDIKHKKHTLVFSKAGNEFKVSLDVSKGKLVVKTFHQLSRR